MIRNPGSLVYVPWAKLRFRKNAGDRESGDGPANEMVLKKSHQVQVEFRLNIAATGNGALRGRQFRASPPQCRPSLKPINLALSGSLFKLTNLFLLCT